LFQLESKWKHQKNTFKRSLRTPTQLPSSTRTRSNKHVALSRAPEVQRPALALCKWAPSALVQVQRSVTCIKLTRSTTFSPQNRKFETLNCQKWSEAQPEALTRQTHTFRDIWIRFTNCLKSIFSKQQVFNYNQNQFFTTTHFNNNNFIHNSYPNLDMRLSTTTTTYNHVFKHNLTTCHKSSFEHKITTYIKGRASSCN